MKSAYRITGWTQFTEEPAAEVNEVQLANNVEDALDAILKRMHEATGGTKFKYVLSAEQVGP